MPAPGGGGALALATVRAFAVRPLVVTSDQTAFSSPASSPLTCSEPPAPPAPPAPRPRGLLTKQKQNVRLAPLPLALPPQALLHDAILQLQAERVRERRLEDVVPDWGEAGLSAKRGYAAGLRVRSAMPGELAVSSSPCLACCCLLPKRLRPSCVVHAWLCWFKEGKEGKEGKWEGRENSPE